MDIEKNKFSFRDSAFRCLALAFFRFILGLSAQIEVKNLERVPMEGALMIASNHLSSWDGFILQLAIPRHMCFMSKAELFRNPVLRWILNKLGSFPVKRGEFDRQSMLNAKNVLDSGLALMMFPEGTRTYGQGMVEARSGTAHLAMRNKCGIIPVALVGTDRIFKNGLKKAGIVVQVCEMIEPGEKENANELTARLMHSIADELPAELRGIYA